MTTPLTRNNKAVGVITKNQAAKSTLKDLGKRKATHGHWSHHIQNVLLECMQGYVLVMMIKHIFSQVKLRNMDINPKYSVIR